MIRPASASLLLLLFPLAAAGIAGAGCRSEPTPAGQRASGVPAPDGAGTSAADDVANGTGAPAPADGDATPDETAADAPPPPMPGAARVRGRVLLDGPAPPQGTRDVSVDTELCGDEPVPDRAMVVDPASKGVRWAVVTLVKASAGDTAASAPAPVTRTLEQARCVYHPYVTVVPPGSTIRVTNADAGLHDVHVIPEDGGGSNRPLRPGSEVEVTLPVEGNMLFACDLHYWTRAWVVVSAAPFAGVTDAEGRFSFEDVPAGDWQLRVWHERLGTVVREVTVPGEGGDLEEIVPVPPPTPLRQRRP